MGRSRDVELWELWRGRLLRFESLNQTIAEFCRWEGVSQAAFYLWRKKLQDEAPGKKLNQRPLFVPVMSAVRSVNESVAVVVMILRDGTRVELPAGDHQLIAHVVKSVADLRGGACLELHQRNPRRSAGRQHRLLQPAP